jgi:murein L,D-transpeptidase YcbB/YkuD
VIIQLTKRPGLVPVRTFTKLLCAAATVAAAQFLSPASAQATSGTVAAAAAIPRGQDVESFYQVRSEKPLWFQGGQPTSAAQALIALLQTSATDGLNPAAYDVDSLLKAMKHASGNDSRDVRKADSLLSSAFTAYARDVANPANTGLQYADPALRLGPPSPLRLLQLAAQAPSLTQFVADMQWMNPIYAQLRRALVNHHYDGDKQREILAINLQRARVLPTAKRYIIVNAPTQRLYMYEDNKVVDWMKVVVGQQKPDRKTPTLAGYLRYASLNPYWNVPPDLVWDDVGVFVEKYGLGYLKSRGYEILSDWSDNATPIDPSTVDWKAVKDGSVQIRVRQLPGPENFLGKIKYTFANPYGIYLHDTPRKELLEKETRLFSGGCIRLQDADRLGRWLFGHTLTATSEDPDIKVPLDKPVPVFVTYLTAMPEGSTVTYLDDVYGWDAERLAGVNPTGATVAAR